MDFQDPIGLKGYVHNIENTICFIVLSLLVNEENQVIGGQKGDQGKTYAL